MTAAAPRTAHGTPDLRRVGVAVGALTVAVALVVGVAAVRQAGTSSATSTGQSRNLVVTGTNGGGINYTGIPYPAPGNDIVVKGTNGGGINYTGIPYPVPQPAPKALPGLHGNPSAATGVDVSSAIYAAQQQAPSQVSSALHAALNSAPAVLPATRGDMSAAAYAAQNAAVAANIANQKATAAAIAARDAIRLSRTDMSSAAYLAQHPALPATPADISAAIYAAQQDAAAKLSAAAWAAQHPAPFVSSATSGDMTMAVWATLHPAPFVLPATPEEINAAIFAAQRQAAAAAINATSTDMSSAAYAAQQQSRPPRRAAGRDHRDPRRHELPLLPQSPGQVAGGDTRRRSATIGNRTGQLPTSASAHAGALWRGRPGREYRLAAVVDATSLGPWPIHRPSTSRRFAGLCPRRPRRCPPPGRHAPERRAATLGRRRARASTCRRSTWWSRTARCAEP